jgi:hypothetical protein
VLSNEPWSGRERESTRLVPRSTLQGSYAILSVESAERTDEMKVFLLAFTKYIYLLLKLAIPASWWYSVIKVSGTTSRTPISQIGVSPYYDNLHRWITDPTLSLTLQDSCSVRPLQGAACRSLVLLPCFLLGFRVLRQASRAPCVGLQI